MNEATKTVAAPPAPPADDADTDLLPVPSYRVDAVGMVRQAADEFEKLHGKPAMYLYAPPPFIFMLQLAADLMLRKASGGKAVRGVKVVSVHGLEIIEVMDSRITVTAEPLHDTIPNPTSETRH